MGDNETRINTTYRINMAFQPQVHEYIKMMARATGKNMTEVTNAIIMQHMREHPESYLKVKQFAKEINGEEDWRMANDTNIIRKTTNYEQFKYLGGNRGVSEMRVKRLMKSISSIGYIQACPIIVNENGQVVDGQARLEACKRLGVPVYYIVEKNIGINECIAMNQSSTNWTLTEYVHKYAVEDKNASYVFLEWAIKTYSSRLGQRLIISICADLPGMGYDNEKLKNGQFDVDFTKAEEIKGCLDYVANVAGVVRKMTGRTEYVLVAIFWLYRHSEANIKRLEQVLGNMVLEAQVNNISIGNTKQALQMLDNAYNHNLKAKERLRFVPMYEDYLIKNYAWYETKYLKSKRG